MRKLVLLQRIIAKEVMLPGGGQPSSFHAKAFIIVVIYLTEPSNYIVAVDVDADDRAIVVIPATASDITSTVVYKIGGTLTLVFRGYVFCRAGQLADPHDSAGNGILVVAPQTGSDHDILLSYNRIMTRLIVSCTEISSDK
ncbi:hypothetical protein J6590_032663 [Homalodisca vitripennis]|nr:hypothetical protein J6590_032663 [Homalodisca vitripennis]